MPSVGRERRGSWGIGLLLAPLVAVLLLSTACSSSPKHAPSFVSSYRSAAANYRTQVGDLQKNASSLVGQSPTAQLTLFDGLTKATSRAHTALAKLDPPATIAGVYRQLVTLLAKQQTTLGQVETAVRSDDRAGLNTELSTYATDLQTGVSLLHQLDQALNIPSPTS